MNLAVFDVIAVVVILVLGVRTAFKGFVSEFMTTLALLVGVGTALIFTSRVATLLTPHIGDTFWTPVVAFLIIFLVAYIVLKIIEATLHRIIDKIQLEKLDQSLGFVLGVLEALLLLAVVVFLLQLQTLISVETLFEESYVAKFLQKIIPIGAEYIEEQLQNTNV